ncbi:MAG: tetratricopeptide repeat protein [Marinicella pacifica]
MKLTTCTVLLCLALIGCQSPTPKAQQTDTDEIAQSEWQIAQKQVIDAVRERQFDDAAAQLATMIDKAGDEDSQWQYIRMVLAVLPSEQAMPLIQQAINRPVIQQSQAHLLAFSRLLMQHKDLAAALPLSNQAVALDKSEAAVYWRARLLAVAKDFLSAEQDYRWLLQQSTDNTDYISQYAALKMQQGDLAAAEDILKIHSEEPRLLYQYILILLQQEKTEQAKQQYQQLMALINRQILTPEEKLDYGEVALWLSDYDTALSLLSDVNDAQHIYAAKLLLARVYLKQDNPDRAMVLFKQVQNAPPEYAVPAFQMAAEYHYEQTDAEQAIAELSEGLRFFKDQPDLLYSRALLYAQEQQVAAAEKDLNKIIEQQPDHADALNALGYTWADNDMNLDQALDYIERANELKPDNSAILDSLGWVHYKRGDLLKAEHFLRESLRQPGVSAETYEHLIVVLEAQNKANEADLIRQKLKAFLAD